MADRTTGICKRFRIGIVSVAEEGVWTEAREVRERTDATLKAVQCEVAQAVKSQRK
jgi:hypothetical protein